MNHHIHNYHNSSLLKSIKIIICSPSVWCFSGFFHRGKAICRICRKRVRSVWRTLGRCSRRKRRTTLSAETVWALRDFPIHGGMGVAPKSSIYDHLVGGLEDEWISFSPSYWEFHHPNWRTPSFFRGDETQPPTSHLFMGFSKTITTIYEVQEFCRNSHGISHGIIWTFPLWIHFVNVFSPWLIWNGWIW